MEEITKNLLVSAVCSKEDILRVLKETHGILQEIISSDVTTD